MPKPQLTYLTFCLLFASLASAIHAQSFRGAQEMVITQNIYAATLEQRPMTETLYYLNTDQEYAAFQIGQKRRGADNRQPLSDKLELFRKGVNEEGETIYAPIMNIRIPKVEHVLVLFYWDKDSKLGTRVLNDTAKAHPSNHGRVLNMTDGKSKAQIGEELLTIDPNKAVLTTNKVINAEESKYFNFAYIQEGLARTQTRPPIRRWRMSNEKQRVLVVLTYGDYTEEIQGKLVHTRMPVVVRMYDSPPRDTYTSLGIN